jgi:hypothetical protein
MLKHEWLLTINDVISEPEMRDIVFNEKILDKINMIPLSSYIVINKVNIERERELSTEDIMKRDKHWYGMECNKMRDMLLLQKIQIFSEYDDHTQHEIMQIIKHAFCVHTSKKLICDFIEKNVRMIHGTGQWDCEFILAFPDTTFKDIAFINWKNVRFFCVFYSFDDHPDDDDARDLLIFVNDNTIVANTNTKSPTTNESNEQRFSPMSLLGTFMTITMNFMHYVVPPIYHYNCILNTFDNSITLQLISWMHYFRKKLISNNHDIYELLHSGSERFSSDLLKIQKLIKDKNAFCYLSNCDKIVIYRAIYPYRVKCIYAATMNQFYFSIFTIEKDLSNDAFLPKNYPKNVTINDIRLFINDKKNFVLIYVWLKKINRD